MIGVSPGTTVEEEMDFKDIEEKYRVELEEGFDNVVVVDGVPVIDRSKYDRLVTKLAKEFSKKGARVSPEKITLPWNDGLDKSKGYAFIEFENPADAAYALNTMHSFQFDSKHQFAVNRFTDIETFAHFDEAFTVPEVESYKPKEHLRSWLADEYGRDQFVINRGDDVEIHWHGKPSQSSVAYSKAKWTGLYVSWSPQGTMLATTHPQGVRLWGGDSWGHLQRFHHPLVTLIDFSPQENYLVTWSNEPFSIGTKAEQGPQHPSLEDEGNSLAVWDIKTGNLLRTFPVAASEQANGENGRRHMQWPALKWSPDDKYVARVVPGQHISVYELPSMSLLNKKSIKIDGVVDFEWCPLGDKDPEDSSKSNKKVAKENVLAYWVPEIANQPARVSLLAVPSRSLLRSKNLFNVTDCQLFWQNQGDYLCVKVDRHTKTKKSLFCNLEIFRMREKEFPVEVVELKDTTVTDFTWEPRGERFAIISSNDPNLVNPGPGITIKTDVSFFQLEKGKNFRLLKSLTSRTTNRIRWSPKGRHVVLATVGSSSKSELEFWDLDFNTEDLSRKEGASTMAEWGSGAHLLGTADHFGVTDIEWDPSGRYLATSASIWVHSLEHGYAIWDFRGLEIVKFVQDRFKQFLWRPRPKSLLSKEQRRQIRRNLKEYSRTFDEEDAAEESNVSAELIAHRKRLVDEWNTWRSHCRHELESKRKERRLEQELEGEEREEVQEWVEEVIDQSEEMLE